MFFVLSKLGWLIVHPLNLLVLAFAAGLGLSRTRWARAGRRVISTAAIVLVASTVLPVGDVLVASLEDRFAPPDPLPAVVEGVLVLGGASKLSVSEARGRPNVNESGERLTSMIELGLRYPESRLVLAGGSGALLPGKLREAEVARRYLASLGFDVSRVLFEGESRNTFENAIFAKRLARPAPERPWLLVTSAVHMPRAMGVFRLQGWPVVPYPVDYQTGGNISFRFEPLERLRLLSIGLREWLGLIVYSAMGRIGELFPAPRPGH